MAPAHTHGLTPWSLEVHGMQVSGGCHGNLEEDGCCFVIHQR